MLSFHKPVVQKVGKTSNIHILFKNDCACNNYPHVTSIYTLDDWSNRFAGYSLVLSLFIPESSLGWAWLQF